MKEGNRKTKNYLREETMTKFVTLVAPTLVRSQEELENIINAFESFTKTGWQIITVNGPSPDDELQKNLISKLKKLPVQIINIDQPSIGNQIQRCLLAGIKSGADVIVYTEGDKYLITLQLQAMTQLILAGKADVCTLSRNWKCLIKFKPTRWIPELLTNILQSLVMHRWGDWQFGPKVFSRHVLLVLEKEIASYKRPGWEIASWIFTQAALCRFRVKPLWANSIKPMPGEDSWRNFHFRIKQLIHAWRGIFDASK